MKYSYLSCLVLGLLVQLSVPTGVSCAEIGSEEKFELMAAALRARDAGDLVTARQFLEQLRYAYPSDPNLERLLRGVNERIDMAAVTGEGDLVSPNNTPPGFPSVEGSPITGSVSAGMDIDALDAMVKAEAERQELALEEAQVARVSAEELMVSGEYEVALAIINRALETLPVSIKTAPMLDELKSLKRDIIFEQAEEAYFAKEVDRSRNLLARFEKLGGRDERSESLSRKLAGRDRGTERASLREYSPALDERERELEELAALGISQFERGYLEAAKGTFAQIEAADPGNVEAKHYQARIAEERQEVGRLDRYKTKGEMLHEVGQGWQRPQVFDRESGAGGGEEENGLREKLQRIVLPRVSFGGVALSRVIDTLSELSVDYDPEREGVNFVMLDPAGSDPTVNITLRNLPLNRILDFVVESAGYEYDIQADAVVVRQGMGGGIRLETEFYPISRSTIIRLTGIGAKYGSRSVSYDPFAPVPETQSGVARSHGGEEEALKSFLQRAGVPFDGVPNANLALADGQLIVTNTTRNLEKVRNILRRYSEIKQVEIEAKFLEVRQGDLEELGVKWAITNSGDNYQTVNRSLTDAFSVDSAETDILLNAQKIASNAAPILPNALDLGEEAGNLAEISGVIGAWEVNAVIRALSRKEGSDLMSAPKVTVLSGKTAEIVVAQEFRYPESFGDIESEVGSGASNTGAAGVTITAGTPQDFVVRNIGVEMEVTPTVEDDNSISLLLEPRVTEFEGFVEYGGPSVAISGSINVTVPAGFFQPIFSVRRVRTEVTIWDGATVVMGGLTREQVQTVEDKVPVLGDIPLIGRLFKSKGESSQKRNLLIFVTANLISPGGSPAQQQFRSIDPGALFQNPAMVTPGGAVNRRFDGRR